MGLSGLFWVGKRKTPRFTRQQRLGEEVLEDYYFKIAHRQHPVFTT
jgi:hypothetical protein